MLIGLSVVLAVTAGGSMWAAFHFHQQAARLSATASRHAFAKPHPVGSLSASARSASTAVADTGGESPPLSSHSFDLATAGRLRATVYLTSASTDGGTSTSGQLIVGGLVRGGQPGVKYQFTGGDCEADSQLDVVWAQGVADANGTAFVTGEARTLPKADNYTLAFGASPPVPGAGLGPGIEGDFVLGQASRYAGEPCN